MNRLRGMKTYLVGAMDRLPDAGAGWRADITPFLEQKGVSVFNPCKKPIDIGVEDCHARNLVSMYKETGQFDKIREEFGVIRTVDLRCVDISDFIVVNIDIDVHTCGTYEEIATANRQKKPVLIWCKQGKSQAPNWLFYMLPHEHIFSSIEDLKSYLKHVDSSKEVHHHKRWFFFDMESLNV